MSLYFMVEYFVAGFGDKRAGPYTPIREAEIQRDDIAGYEGVAGATIIPCIMSEHPVPYIAKDLVADRREKLVGTVVMTNPHGGWEGGECVIVSVEPDMNAPDIAFHTKRLSDDKDMGVFDSETVTV